MNKQHKLTFEILFKKRKRKRKKDKDRLIESQIIPSLQETTDAPFHATIWNG